MHACSHDIDNMYKTQILIAIKYPTSTLLLCKDQIYTLDQQLGWIAAANTTSQRCCYKAYVCVCVARSSKLQHGYQNYLLSGAQLKSLWEPCHNQLWKLLGCDKKEQRPYMAPGKAVLYLETLTRRINGYNFK